MLSEYAHPLTLGSGIFDGFKQDIKDAIEETVIGGVNNAAEKVNEIIEAVIMAVITPPLPDGAAVYVDGAEPSGLFNNYWDAILDLNEALTEITIGLFGLFFIIYLIGLGVGVVNQSDMAQSFFTMLIGFVILVNNVELLNLGWALIYGVSEAIIEIPIGDSNTGTSIGGAIAGASVGGAAAISQFGVSIVMIPVLIVILFLAVCLLFVQIIAVTGYAAFPLIVGGWLVGNVFGAVRGYTNKLNGFFIPAMYSSIPLALVFKVGSMFVGTGIETQEGAGAFVGSAALSLFGPVFALGTVVIGIYVVLKSFQAGAAVVGGVSKGILAAATVGVAAATGGVGAAARGFAMRGTTGAAGNVTANALQGGGEGSGFSPLDRAEGAPDDLGEEDSESSTGVLGGLSDFGKGVDRKIYNRATSGLGGASARIGDRVPDSIVDTSDRSPSTLLDRVTPDGQGVLGEGDTVTDPMVGLEEFNENKDAVMKNIENGSVGAEDAVEAMVNSQADQLGLSDSHADELKEFHLERFRSLQDTEHPFKSENQTAAEAFGQWSTTSFSEDELSNMGLSGTLSGGKATSGQSVVGTLDSQLANKNSRQEFRANPMAGMTSGNTDDYGAEYVSFGGVVDGNEKSERLQFSTNAVSELEYDTAPSQFRMQSQENGMVEFSFDPGVISDNVGDDHAIYNAEQTDSGTFVMSADKFAKNMDVIPFGEINAMGDRESAILLESTIKDNERNVQETLKTATNLETEGRTTFDNVFNGRINLDEALVGDAAAGNIEFVRDDHRNPSTTGTTPQSGNVDKISFESEPDTISQAIDFQVQYSEKIVEQSNRPSESSVARGNDSVTAVSDQKETEERIKNIEEAVAKADRRVSSRRANALRKFGGGKF